MHVEYYRMLVYLRHGRHNQRHKSTMNRRTVRIKFVIALVMIVWVTPLCYAGNGSNGDRGLEGFQYVEPSSEFSFRVERFAANPIIHREMEGLIGAVGRNINGPSLIRVPDWIENPLGTYYLYFAHHQGDHIRMAYADRLEGPWTIYSEGVLQMEHTPAYDGAQNDHVASPDMHIDHERRQIRMYYHADPRPGKEAPYQMSYVALSVDGLHFESMPDALGLFYFRVFQRDGWHYALAKYKNDGGVIYRSRDGLTDFEEGPRILPRVRHKALWEHNDQLYVFFSRGFDEPEHILVSRVENLDDDWTQWTFTHPQTVLRPERDFEGAFEPIEPSRFGATYEFVHQLRDPGIFEEDGRVFLLYSTAGERAIAIAEIFLEEH